MLSSIILSLVMSSAPSLATELNTLQTESFEGKSDTVIMRPFHTDATAERKTDSIGILQQQQAGGRKRGSIRI